MSVEKVGFIYKNIGKLVGMLSGWVDRRERSLGVKGARHHKQHLLWLARGTLPKDHYLPVSRCKCG